LLRSSYDPVEDHDLRAAWQDVAQRDRALASLVQDGLVVPVGNGWSLPS
jgi:A/G-specific adenine glycosylase